MFREVNALAELELVGLALPNAEPGSVRAVSHRSKVRYSLVFSPLEQPLTSDNIHLEPETRSATIKRHCARS